MMARIQSEVHGKYDEVCVCGEKGGEGGGGHIHILQCTFYGA
jgi:hypothetical protein